jgi:hypothetical protein
MTAEEFNNGVGAVYNLLSNNTQNPNEGTNIICGVLYTIWRNSNNTYSLDDFGGLIIESLRDLHKSNNMVGHA